MRLGGTVLLVLAELGGAATALATEVPARIGADATWTAGDNPYVIAEDVTVAADATLLLEPGVVVELGEGRSLVIEGALIARGSEAAPITFTGDAEARWRSVIFANSSADAVFDAIDDYRSGSVIERCVFEHAVQAVEVVAASPYIARNTFRDNKIRYSGDLACGPALILRADSAPRVVENTFEDNAAEGTCYGGALYAEQSAPIIQDNVFTGNTSAYGGALTTDNVASPIVGNTFERNRSLGKGGAISVVSTQSALLNNRVADNESNLDGAGVHVCVDCFPHATPFLMDNVIVDNVATISGSGGVGAAFLRTFAYNDLHGNQSRGAPSDFGWFNSFQDLYPDWVHSPSIAGNWWGTTDRAAIDATVFDGADDEKYGRVNVEPFAEGPVAAPTTRVLITTRKLRYGIPGQPMPVYLTLYNPGPERAVDLVIALQYDGDPPVFYRGPLGFPGAERIGDRWRLLLPENAVWFGVPVRGTFAEADGPTSGAWHAATFERETGRRVGDVSTIRFDFGAEEESE